MPGGQRNYTATLAAAQDACTVPCDGLEGIVFSCSGGLSGTVTFEGSVDGTTFFPLPAYGNSSGFQLAGAYTNPPTQLFYVGGGPGLKVVRGRCSAFTSGSTILVGAADASQAMSLTGVATLNSTIASSAGSGVTSQTGALTKHRLLSAASTNLTSVKGSAGNLYAISVANDGATKAFLKLYDKATAPVPASDTPARVILLPPNSMQFFSFTEFNRFNFGTGLGYGIVGLIADNDTTAVAAAQVALDLQYA